MVDNRGYTVDDALDAVGFGRFQWALLLLSGFGFFATTVELILMAIVSPKLQGAWPELSVSNRKVSLLQSSVFAGELLGGLIWGTLSDKLGRRGTFIGTAGMASIFATLAAFSPSYWAFVICRFALGIAIGGSLSIDFIYFVEFVPSKSRGVRTSFIIFLGICAFFYVSFLGFALDGLSWRVFVFACGLPNIGLLVGRLFWQWESPRFLLTKGRLYEATMVLKDMAKFNNKALPPGQLISLESTVAVANEVRPWYSSYADIWQSGLALPVATISILFFGQTFGYYGLTIWMRRLIVAKGIQNLSTPSMFLVIGAAELPNLLLTKFLIEKSGRKAVLMVNFLGSSLSSIILIFANSRFPFLVASGLTYFFIVGSWTALYVLAPEMFPTQVRASAFGIAQCVGKLAGFLSPLFFAWLWDTRARPVTIVMIIAGCFVVAALTAALLLIETSGKRLSDSIETPQTFKK